MPPQNPQAAIRLIFEYDGDDVRLVSEQPVRMIVPDEEPRLEAAASAAGVYVDARDAANATIASVRADSQEGEQTQFNAACASLVAALTAAPPFDDFTDVINVFRVNVRSKESGADDPIVGDGGTGAKAKTFFDAPSDSRTCGACSSATTRWRRNVTISETKPGL